MSTPINHPLGSEPFLRINQVAAHLNTPIPTIREWAKSGKLQYFKPGKVLLFLLSDVTAFMALHRRRSNTALADAAAAKHQELAAFTTKAKRV